LCLNALQNAMSFNFTSPDPSDPNAKQSFKVFQDGGTQARGGTQTRLNSIAPPSEKSRSHVNDEDTPKPQVDCSNLSVVTSGTMSTMGINTSVKRAPLADVTKAVVTRSRSLSNALAEIARLEDDLNAMKSENKVLKGKNRKLRGEIVAYQDALYQADQDAGYL
jgi:hypothetical protein